MDILELTNGIHVAMSQPDELDFPRFAESGYKTIIDMRSDMEDHLLPPEEEEKAASAEGVAYIHFPVSSSTLDAETAENFCKIMSEAEKPVLAHCKGGIRSGAFAMIYIAMNRGTSAQEIMRQASAMGFDCGSPFWRFAGRYVNSLRQR